MYVVFGATGQTGSSVAHTLLEKSLPVRVVLRSEKNAETWLSQGAEVAIADVTNVDAMTKALSGATAVYVINPPAYNVTDMFAIAQTVGQSYREAIQRSSVEKVVLLSSVGAQLPQGTGNILTTHILENIFSELDIPRTFLRAAWFMENWSGVASIAKQQGVLPSFLVPLERKIPMVSTDDIGRTAAEVMTEDWTDQRIIELSGAADYSPNGDLSSPSGDLSPIDVAEAFSDVLQQKVEAIPIPESDWSKTLSSFGFTPEVVENWSEMLRGFNSNYINFEEGVEQRKGKITIQEAVKKIAIQQNLISAN